MQTLVSENNSLNVEPVFSANESDFDKVSTLELNKSSQTTIEIISYQNFFTRFQNLIDNNDNLLIPLMIKQASYINNSELSNKMFDALIKI